MVDRARRLGRWFLALDSLLVILGFFVVMPMISLRFVDQLGWAAGVVGLALGLRQLTQQGLGSLAAPSPTSSGAPLIVCGMLLRALGFASLAYAQSGLELILSCIISGLGGCLFDPPRRPGDQVHPATGAGRYISLLMMLESAGAVVGALLGSWLLNFDFEYVCLLGAGLFVCAALCNLLILPPKLSVRPTPIRDGLGQVLADKAFCRLVLILSGLLRALGAGHADLPHPGQTDGRQHHGGGLDVHPWRRPSPWPCSTPCPVRRAPLQAGEPPDGGVLLMTTGIGLVAFATTLPAVFLLLACFYLGIVIAEPARETLMTKLAQPGRGAATWASADWGWRSGHDGLRGGRCPARLRHGPGQPWLPWLVLGTVGVTTLLLLANCFQRGSRLAGGQRLILWQSSRLPRAPS